MKAFFWAADATGSGWYRSLLPAQSLTWLGHDAAANMAISDGWRAVADVIIGARVCHPGGPEAWRRFRDAGKRLVLDLDDDYWHLDVTNPVKSWWTPEKLVDLETNLHGSDVVTVVTEALAEVVRQHTDTPVVVVPNGLHAGILGTLREYDRPRVRVGWAGTGSTVHELHIAARALRRIAEYRNVDVRLVGVPPRMAAAAGAAHANIKTLGWLDSPGRYLEGIGSFDILVAPYRDIPFNRAKFPTKALEAGFLGIPIVASDIRPYREAVDVGETGFLVREDHEWGHYLKQLVDDVALRRRMGLAARAKASASILQVLNKQWEAVLAPERTPA